MLGMKGEPTRPEKTETRFILRRPLISDQGLTRRTPYHA